MVVIGKQKGIRVVGSRELGSRKAMAVLSIEVNLTTPRSTHVLLATFVPMITMFAGLSTDLSAKPACEVFTGFRMSRHPSKPLLAICSVDEVDCLGLTFDSLPFNSLFSEAS